MKAFRFRPETVLRLRRRARDAAHVELGRAQRAKADADTELARSVDAMTTAAAAFRDVMASGGEGETFERYRTWMVGLRTAVDGHRVQVDRHQQVVDARAAVLKTAHQQVRVVERLRERAERRYDDEARRQALKAMDELAGQQYARRLIGGDENT